MTMLKKLALSAALAAGAVIPAVGLAQVFPAKPITIVVPFPAGGAADASARIVAQKLGDNIKQPVLVDNRPGAGGQIAASAVKRSPADGYTLFLANTGSHAANQALYSKLSYDPEKDFEPVIAVVQIPQLLVVPAASPVKTAAELIARAKAHPGSINYASQSVGAGGHIAAEILKSRNGVQINHIPYKGSAAALTDLVAGRVDFMFDAIPSSLPFVKDKRLRALAIDAPKRSALLPDVPTLVEQGLTGYEASPWFGLVAPAGTPQPVIDRLHDEVAAVLRSPDVLSRLDEMGMTAVGGTAREFSDLMKSDTRRLGAVIRESGAKLD
ncbi:Bug family tripartite tricarboxylate transporter substrate binding protein [Variovorax sp. M-6]|uniref:Bug family tripartite tricarboxylate transporter substrate binding protein n=1 Tax=Variovorax sp. M-6 TaxID=3233041 RepID=UPI003F9C9986